MGLDPWWITGFTDGEGCFSVSFNLREKLKMKVEVRPSFSLSQSARSDKDALEGVKAYFQCGDIRYGANDGTYKYEVRSIEKLVTQVLPHFETYPLATPKRKDYLALQRICSLMRRNLHQNPQGLAQIIDLAYTMNPAGKRRYSKEALLKIIGS